MNYFEKMTRCFQATMHELQITYALAEVVSTFRRLRLASILVKKCVRRGRIVGRYKCIERVSEGGVKGKHTAVRWYQK